ncbi:MAG TPA: hypothetical protein VE860_08145 [Chthoniobacterales bacterium]|jgi:hypothetical protein|nr:hypothetical protein [Chthoniobacterales bacterium]
MIGNCESLAAKAVTSVSKGLAPVGGLFAEAIAGVDRTIGDGVAELGE